MATDNKSTVPESVQQQIIASVEEKLKKLPGLARANPGIHGVNWKKMLANYDLADYSENEIARAAQKIVDFLGYYDKNRTGQKSNSGLAAEK